MLANAGILGVGFTRLGLHVKLRRAESQGDFQEVMRLLKRLKNLPATPLGRSLCEVMILRTGNQVRDWAVVEETWSSIQSRPKMFVRYMELAAGSYALSLNQRGLYQKARDITSQLPHLHDITTGVEEWCRVQTLLVQMACDLKLGNFEQARDTLEANRNRFRPDDRLLVMSGLVEANLDYQQGEQARSAQTLLRLTTEPKTFASFQDNAVAYGLVRGLCRCRLLKEAQAVFPDTPSTHPTPRIREMRLLASAELARLGNKTEKALSYYFDLKALETVDAEAYVQASNLCKQLGLLDRVREFLETACYLDPESHWARVAEQKLRKLEG